MINRKWSTWIAVGTLAAAGFGVRHYAVAQLEAAPPPPGADGGGGGGFRRGGGGFGGGFGGGQLVVSSNNNVYVMRGNMVYRLNSASLAVEARATLPNDMPAGLGNNAAGGGGGRRFRGGGGAPPPPADNGGDQAQ